MITKTVEDERLNREIEKCVISCREDWGGIDFTIEEKELEGWTFVNSRNQHGFTHLYFTRIE